MSSSHSNISLIRHDENHAHCLGEPCEAYSIYCVALSVVDETICLAQQLIKEDTQALLLYKRPLEAAADEVSYDSDETEEVCWVSIEYFSLSEGLMQIHDFIAHWDLSPFTKYIVEPKGEAEVPGLGKHYYVDALFSKPMPRCPNPLAVAVVHFALHVSKMLPRSYPIMVTYRFEGYKTTYYALGHRCNYSLTFQRFYIDTILHMKLSFYAKICECAYPDPAEPEPEVKFIEIALRKKTLEEDEDEELDPNYGRLIS